MLLFFPCVLNRIRFLILGSVYNDLRSFLLGAGCPRVPFVVTTLGLRSEVELWIGAIFNRSWFGTLVYP